MRVISLDIETYGAVEKGLKGHRMPPQRFFNAYRSLYFDAVNKDNLVQTVGITPATGESLDTLTPHSSICLYPYRKAHYEVLCDWLQWADAICLHNGIFDITYLRAAYPSLPFDDQLLIENMVLNYLSNEARESRSLKDIAVVRGIHTYSRTLKHSRFKGRLDPELIRYQCEDTHTTLLEVIDFAKELVADDRLTDECIRLYSGLLWACVRMETAGYPFQESTLLTQKDEWEKETESLQSWLRDNGVIVKGKGSLSPDNPESRYGAMQRLVEACDSSKVKELLGVDSILDMANPQKPDKGLLLLTEKAKLVSANIQNRNLIRHFVDEDLQHLIDQWNRWAKLSKLLTSYIYPLLDQEKRQKSCLIPVGDALLGYPSIYPVPSSYAGDDEGGQIQGRISFQNPGTQTFPSAIKSLASSRFGPDGVLASWDVSQLEPRTAAVLSGEPVLLDDFANGGDVHTTQALFIYNKDDLHRKYADVDEEIRLTKHNKEFKKNERQMGKGTGLASLYRSGAVAQQQQTLKQRGILIPIDILRKSVKLLPSIKPTLFAWQESLIREAHTNKRIVLEITGQQRQFFGGSLHKPNEAVNFPVQCHGANCISRLLYYVHRQLTPDPQDVFLYQCTHDSLSFDCANPDVVRRIDKMLTQAVEWLVNEDYWHRLQTITGNTCPFVLEPEDDITHLLS